MILNKTALGRICILILVVSIRKLSFAQDPQFSQFYASPVYTNPAFAGSSKVGRLILNTRNQWPGVSGSFSTVNASYDEHFDAINGGIAIQAHYDEQGTGTLRTIGASFGYAYQIPISRKFTVRLALQGGFMQKTIDFTKFLWYSQLGVGGFDITRQAEPIGTPEGRVNIINVSTGMIGYSKNFYFGLAVHNLTEPDQSFNVNNKAIKAPIFRRYTGNVGFVVPLKESRVKSRSSYLYPNIIYMQQGFSGRQFNQLNLGVYASKGALIGGLYFRNTSQNADAIIAILGIRTDNVKIGFSYDNTVSIASAGAVGSYEVSLAFELRKKVRRKNPRIITCPEF
jgi:type IX secretion system PorP/SprF family membrane protein